MDHLPRVSEALYVGLCHYIGTPTEVTIRREVIDIDEKIRTPNFAYKGLMYMKSGSYKEGFRFKSSDLDAMIWYTKHKVICDISQFKFSYPLNLDFVLMDHSETPSGFVKLRLLFPRRDMLPLEIIQLRDISSEKFRRKYYHFLKRTHTHAKTLRFHGPCSSYNIEHKEFDRGWCVACQYWPPAASSWIDRCQQKGWPERSVLDEIVSNGCHVMPIGSKREPGESELEWRLSFSQAEQKIVYSMNHTQFICYGVLKIFLKEVICSGNQDSLICSYYLKNILFWEIQNNPDSSFWCPQNLLSCFWVCFKRLCRYVLDSNCPNFFIPENNMCKDKIVGSSREALLSQLNGYYKKGVACLQLSITLSSILSKPLSSPSFVIPFIKGHDMTVLDIDKCIRREFFQRPHYLNSAGECLLLLRSVNCLIQLQLSQFQTLRLQHNTAKILVQTAFFLANQSLFKSNKVYYITDQKILNLLKFSASIGPVSYLLYIGIYYYSTGRYSKVFHITDLSQKFLADAYDIYSSTVNKIQYDRFVGKLSLEKRMKKCFIDDMHLNRWTLREVFLEEQISCQGQVLHLLIPPFVLVHMLNVLCSFRIGNMSKSLQSMKDLHTMLHHDKGLYVKEFQRDISWHILGICQHVLGELHGALLSYQMSLRQKPFHRIQRYTESKKRLVLQQLNDMVLS